MKEKRGSLTQSLIAGSVLFILAFCILLSVINYREHKEALYGRYDAYITDILTYASSEIDVDDLAECLETGEKSEKYDELQLLMNKIKDTHQIDYMYIVIPLNTEDENNMMNVMAAMSKEEIADGDDRVNYLGLLSGDDYSAETAAKYYDAMDKDKIVFFENVTKWGDDYTGVLQLKTSDGSFFAELCVDVRAAEIHDMINKHVMSILIPIVAIGVLFMIMFVLWTQKNVISPIHKLEKSVSGFTANSRDDAAAGTLVMKSPDIHTNNELESLADATVNMAVDIREYVTELDTARREAERLRSVAAKMAELAKKDSLTGVKNKTAYDLATSEISGEYGIAMVDLNGLKQINDDYGHDKGDIAIKKICSTICGVFAHSPVYRFGGDEFVVLLTGKDLDNIGMLSEKFYENLAGLEGTEPWEKVTGALGYAVSDGTMTYEEVFEQADKEMYEAKTRMKSGE